MSLFSLRKIVGQAEASVCSKDKGSPNALQKIGRISSFTKLKLCEVQRGLTYDLHQVGENLQGV